MLLISRWLGVLAAFSIGFFLFSMPGAPFARGDAPGRISIEQARKMLEKNSPALIVLDVRTPAEYANGHIAAARNMNFFGPRFEEEMSAFPREAPIMVYCNSGRRSEGAAAMLKEAGFKEVYDMHQGITGWKKAGLPLIQ